MKVLSVEEAIKAGERTLKLGLRDLQKARLVMQNALKHDPGTAQDAEKTGAAGVRCAKIETYILHAISTLPDDRMSRLRALHGHLEAVEVLIAD